MSKLVCIVGGIALMAFGGYVLATNDESIGALPVVLGFAFVGYGLSKRSKDRDEGREP